MAGLSKLFNQENIYIIQALLVMLVVLVADLSQKKIFSTFAKKAERTQNKWDDALLLAIPRPLSAIIWITGITFTGDIGTFEEISFHVLYCSQHQLVLLWLYQSQL